MESHDKIYFYIYIFFVHVAIYLLLIPAFKIINSSYLSLEPFMHRSKKKIT